MRGYVSAFSYLPGTNFASRYSDAWRLSDLPIKITRTAGRFGLLMLAHSGRLWLRYPIFAAILWVHNISNVLFRVNWVLYPQCRGNFWSRSENARRNPNRPLCTVLKSEVPCADRAISKLYILPYCSSKNTIRSIVLRSNSNYMSEKKFNRPLTWKLFFACT